MEQKERLNTLFAVFETDVDPSEIYLSEEWQTISGDVIPPQLVIPIDPDASNQPGTFVDILAFVGDWQINLASTTQRDEIVPETEDDERILASFGTRDVHSATSLTVAIRTFSMSNISREELELLIERQSGLKLYAQALDQRDQVGKFREFWRVLEAGFGEQKQELVKIISAYQPAVELGFSEEELDGLYILRGRASHADSKAGIEEIRSVNIQVGQKLSRLKCLVEQVILTKKSWGFPTLDTQRMSQLTSYVDSDGGIVIFRESRQDSATNASET